MYSTTRNISKSMERGNFPTEQIIQQHDISQTINSEMLQIPLSDWALPNVARLDVRIYHRSSSQCPGFATGIYRCKISAFCGGWVRYNNIFFLINIDRPKKAARPIKMTWTMLQMMSFPIFPRKLKKRRKQNYRDENGTKFARYFFNKFLQN